MEYRSRRHPALGKVSLRLTDGSEIPGELLDASDGGAKVQVVGDFAQGTRVRLCAGRLEIWSSIRWSNDGEIGLRFERDLARADLDELVKKPYARGRAASGRWMYGA